MSEYRKANSDHWYFVTMSVVGWVDVFTQSMYCDTIIESLKFCQKEKKLKISAYVIMPNHIHMIVQHDDSKLGAFFRDFKSFTAKKIISEIENNKMESRKDWMLHIFKYHAKFKKQNKVYQFWQKTNYPVLLDTAKIFDQKRDYIHQNPVKSRLVNIDSSYVFSSANPDQPIELCY